MATSNKANLLAGIRKGEQAEKQKVDARFERADEIMAQRPAGLVGPGELVAVPTFAGESRAGEGRALPLRRLPLKQLRDNPYNARRIYDPNRVKEMAANLAAVGQRVPAYAVAHETDPDIFIIIDGRYRRLAAEAAGIEFIDAVIGPSVSAAEMYRLSFTLNEFRTASTPLDNALVWHDLLVNQTVAKEEDLVTLTGLSWPTVNKTLALMRLPVAVHERMREAPAAFGLTTSYELTQFFKLAGEEETTKLVERIIAEDLGRRDVEAIRKAWDSNAKAKPERKQKDMSRQYRIRTGGQQTGIIKEWDSGRVSLDVKVLDPKVRADLVAELKQRFNIE